MGFLGVPPDLMAQWYQAQQAPAPPVAVPTPPPVQSPPPVDSIGGALAGAGWPMVPQQPSAPPMPLPPHTPPAPPPQAPVDFTMPDFGPAPRPPQSPGDMQGHAAAVDRAQQENMWAQGKLAEAQAPQQQRMQGMQSQAVADDRTQMQANYQAHEERLAQVNQKANQLRSQIRSWADTNVDPNQLFKTAKGGPNIWAGILMGISVGISGFLNPRGPNLALAAIERMIDRNIAVQESNLARKGRALHAEESMLDSERDQTNDWLKTAEGKRAAAWELVGRELEIAGKQTTDDIQRATALAMRKEAELKAAQARYDAAKSVYAQEEATKRSRIQAGATIGAAKQNRIGAMEREVLRTATELPVKAYNAETNRIKAEKQGQGQRRQLTDPENPSQILGTVSPAMEKEASARVLSDRKAERSLNRLLDTSTSWWERRPNALGMGSDVLKGMATDFSYLAAWAKGKGQLELGQALLGMEDDILKGATGTGPDTWTTKDPQAQLSRLREILYESAQDYGNVVLQGGQYLAPLRGGQRGAPISGGGSELDDAFEAAKQEARDEAEDL